jgi:ATP-binding cassette subfamily F protein 3
MGVNIVISLVQVYKNYGYEPVLEDLTLTVYPGEKIGLIGANGSGKTTIFHLITGQERPDRGAVSVPSRLGIGHLAQVPAATELTVAERLLQGVAHLRCLENQIRQLERRLSKCQAVDSETERLLVTYAELVTAFEQAGGYEYKTRIEETVTGLGLTTDKKAPVNTLSGGERARLELAVVLLQRPDVLLLDEPTNHLDFSALEWLERYISCYSGTAVIISHDRYFLDRTVSRIIEVYQGRAREFSGNYSFYLEQRDRLHKQAVREYQTQQKEIKRKEASIKRLRQWAAAADNEKFFRRAANIQKQIDRMEKVENPDAHLFDYDLRFCGHRSGKEVLRLDNVSLTLGHRTLFRGLDWQVRYGEKLGLTGPNGAGKTSLIRLLLGELQPDSGCVYTGASLKIGYLPQQPPPLSDEETVLVAFRSIVPQLAESRARALLAKYGFSGDLVFKPLVSLSGGERVRFQLLKMVYTEVNLLILDEPTNHLDLPSVETLEEAVLDYKGTLLVVSHDRRFLNRVIEGIYVLDSGKLNYYPGNYDYYASKQAEKRAEGTTASPDGKKSLRAIKSSSRIRSSKFSRKLNV